MIHVYTGNGKGKTTAGMGLCARCAGYDKKIAIFQFMKTKESGECKTLSNCCDFFHSDIEFGFVYTMLPEELTIAKKTTVDLFEKFLKVYRDYDVVMLDEVFSAVECGFIPCDTLLEVCGFFKTTEKELILTGRNPGEKLINISDYVSEINLVKHPYDKKTPARKGVEF